MIAAVGVPSVDVGGFDGVEEENLACCNSINM
jgi:hypothetical protein